MGLPLQWLLLLPRTREGLWGAWASAAVARGPNSCSSRALEHTVNGYGTQASLFRNMWDLPGAGIKPVSPGRFFTTESPEKHLRTVYLNHKLIKDHFRKYWFITNIIRWWVLCRQTRVFLAHRMCLEVPKVTLKFSDLLQGLTGLRSISVKWYQAHSAKGKLGARLLAQWISPMHQISPSNALSQHVWNVPTRDILQIPHVQGFPGGW